MCQFSKTKQLESSGTPCVSKDGEDLIVMDRYRMSMRSDDQLGKGSYSICRRGINVKTSEVLAIKTYRDNIQVGRKIAMAKFNRQIEVLTDLQNPFELNAAEDLWHEKLAITDPSQLFVRLLDYSKTPEGPGPDPNDNLFYVITEAGQLSLKDFIASRRDKDIAIPKESVRRISRSILLVVAGLHTKGWVHLDLKPENLMLFNGFLKLIDVDGCVKVGTKLSITDPLITFSPRYCAPEWSRFMLSESDNVSIDVHPGLDAWSAGMTLCELVSLRPVLKGTYGNLPRTATSKQGKHEAQYEFMSWLSGIKVVPLPIAVDKHDPEFVEMIVEGLLVCNQANRSSCAECLSSPYISRIPDPCQQQSDFSPHKKNLRRVSTSSEEDSKQSPFFRGRWKHGPTASVDSSKIER